MTEVFEVPPEWRVSRFCGTVTDGISHVLIFETAADPDVFIMARMLGMTMEFSGVAFPVSRSLVRTGARRALVEEWDHARSLLT